eukprot:4247287-Amphidinium_carterae.1
MFYCSSNYSPNTNYYTQPTQDATTAHEQQFVVTREKAPKHQKPLKSQALCGQAITGRMKSQASKP